MFVIESARLARGLTDAAIRFDGRCTWLADEIVSDAGGVKRRAGTLGPAFATGTAGVGWFLARVASASGERDPAEVGIEALRYSLAGAEELLSTGDFGWYRGTTGIAWAAADAGRTLGRTDLIDEANRLVGRTRTAVQNGSHDPKPAGLFNGMAGTLAGLAALAKISDDPQRLGVEHTAASHLIDIGNQWLNAPSSVGRSNVGLAEGASGIGVALMVWSAASGDSDASRAALTVLDFERPWCGPSWLGSTTHAWRDSGSLSRSMCSGAAGIGLARLLAYRQTEDDRWLAEAGAAIEVIRRTLPRRDADTSLCHGLAGEIEFLVAAAKTLEEPLHLEAARRLAAQLIDHAGRRGRYSGGFGPLTSHPSLLFGLAGTGLTLLRVEDPHNTPSALCPTV